MAYNSEKMQESLNIALRSICERHQPPISDIVSMLGSAIVQTINTCVAIEDRQELAKDVCDGILELIINQVN